MTSKDSVEKINKIELLHSNNFKYNNFDYWPLFRLVLWKYLSSKNRYVEKKDYFNLLLKIAKWVSFNFKNYIYSDNFYDSRIFFLGNQIAINKVKRLDLNYDRIFDPIIKNLNSKYFKKIYVDNTFISNNRMAYPFSGIKCYYNLNLRNNKIPHLLNKIIIKICTQNNLNKDYVLKNFRDEFVNLNSWYDFGKKIFKKYREVKTIYLYPWYSSSIMGLILASREFKVKSIDVQHGIQGQYQAMYNHWLKVPKNGYQMLPQYFACWDQITIKNHNLNSNINFKKYHKSILVRESWMKFYKKNIFKKKIFKGDKTLLFCLQLSQNKNQPVPKFLIDYISSDLSKNIKFIFRIHPNDKGILKHLKRVTNKFKKRREIIIDKGEHTIYDAFNLSTHSITSYSTTCVEAQYFGLKSAVFGIEASENLSYIIKDKKIKLLSQNFKELAKWLN